MADTVGQKRLVLFPNLPASGRRSKVPTEAPAGTRAMANPGYSQEGVIRANPSKPRPRGGVYSPTTTDELASALLEDSTLDQQPGYERLRSEEKPSKPSPHMPRNSRKRRNKTSARPRGGSSRPNSGIHAENPFPKYPPGALNPLGMNPPMVVASTLAPLSAPKEQLDSKAPCSNNPGPAGPEYPAHESERPLAATRPMKRSKSRPIKNVFKKMADALADRFQGKAQMFTKTRGNLGGSRSEIFPARPAMNKPGTWPPEVPGELWHQQGGKVRENMGYKSGKGRMPGNVAPKYGKPLRDTKSLEDPCYDAACKRRSLTDFERHLRERSASETDVSFVPLLPTKDPFQTEDILGSCLDAFLPSTPLATSTPRIRLERYSATLNTPTKQSKEAATHVLSPSLGSDLSDPQLLRSSRDSLGCKSLLEGNHSETPVRKRRATLGYSYIPVLIAKDRKKHPSPNKCDLQLLETTFREEYPRLTGRLFDGKDELAASFTSPFQTEAQGSGKSKSRTSNDDLSEDSTNNEFASSKPKDTGPARHSGGSQSSGTGPLNRSRAKARFTIYRDLPRESFETDELQWDMKSPGRGVDAVC